MDLRPRCLGHLLLLALAVSACAGPVAPTAAGPSPVATPSASDSPSASANPTPTPTPEAMGRPSRCQALVEPGWPAQRSRLSGVQLGRHDTFDRIVFTLVGGSASASVGPAIGPFTGPSGKSIAVAGTSYVQVRLNNTSSADADGSHALGLTRLVGQAGGLVSEVRQIQDFEAVSVWVIGLRQTTSCLSAYRLTGPQRLVVDLYR